ncbi:hypothetical protein [Corynebacterium imitans]|nr:hypothetical protein [Corynebacterium imitans]
MVKPPGEFGVEAAGGVGEVRDRFEVGGECAHGAVDALCKFRV